jgi:hypothetical protein
MSKKKFSFTGLTLGFLILGEDIKLKDSLTKKEQITETIKYLILRDGEWEEAKRFTTTKIHRKKNIHVMQSCNIREERFLLSIFVHPHKGNNYAWRSRSRRRERKIWKRRGRALSRPYQR